MVRENLKGVICALIVGFLLTVSVAVAFAATSYAESQPYIYTLNGYSYKNYAALNVSSALQGALGIGHIEITNGGTAPAGYMGMSAKLYDNGGTIVSAGSWVFNNNPAASLMEGSGYDSTHGYYQGGADNAAFNGSSYVHFWANNTVKLYYPT